ncbi:MAG: PD40 domain-containing protein [Gemmatimonadetes bacterium]|nr:PD40 domain-containing protein [Gemmatimonadota bacterium]
MPRLRKHHVLATLLLAAPLAAQLPQPAWDVTQPRGRTREIAFTTDEGTWMSVDLAADGSWLTFDLLGHVYRLPTSGGEAVALTQTSGIAINTHPRISPDGSLIAFISDRRGQNNLWVMNADGSNPRPIFTDNYVRAVTPVWTPDGQYIVVERQGLPNGGAPGSGGIWMYHKDGGSGVEILPRSKQPASWPAFARDGKYLYFQVGNQAPTPAGYSGRADFLGGSTQVRRMDMQTGEVSAVSFGEQQQQVQTSSGGMGAPEVSPDGKWLAFVRRIPDGTITWKGHEFGPRSALWLRNLETGHERLLMDPVEQDIFESFKVLRQFPGYSWARDGRSIVLMQGGRIRRVDVASGVVTTIPFTAKIQRTISELANFQGKEDDGPMPVQFTRWSSASPDGRRLAFQAVGRVWVMDLPNGTPRRVTPAGFVPFEYAPAWSPDGQWLAFTSWEDTVSAHLWKVSAAGGTPQQLTRVAGEYIHPSFKQDGSEIVLARGAGESRHGRGVVWNAFWDIVRVSANGGDAQFVTRVAASPDGTSGSAFNNIRNQIVRPSYGPEGRIWYPHMSSGAQGTQTVLYSIRPDGSDRQAHLSFPFADEVMISPDGQHVAFAEGDNAWVMPFPTVGLAGQTLRIDRNRSRLPATRLTMEGGLFPTWRTATTLDYGSADRFYSYSVATKRADTTRIALRVPRDIPSGTVAFTNARVVTLKNREVLTGTLVVTGNRISCVGRCAVPSGARVFNARGKTIIPGFIDVHSHNYREHRGIIPQQNPEGAIFLSYGITTTMDPSMWSQNLFPTREMVEAGLVVGPRVYTTGDPLYAGDGNRQEDFTTPAMAEAGILKLKHWGSVSLKQYQQPRRDQRQWVMEAARKHGMQVTSENGDLEYTLGMVMDGHTGFEHPLSYTPLYGDVTRFFGMAQATYSPTFMVGGPGPWNEEYWYQESEVWKDAKTRRFLPWVTSIPQARRRMMRPATDYSYGWIAQGMADMIAAGGFGAIGAHGQHNGLASHWEVWMAAAATGPMGALEVASLHGARFIGREKDLGSLEVGKYADFMVLNANPLDNIRNTANIQYVVKGGVVYDDETLDEVWPRQRPYGTPYWIVPDALKMDRKPIR